MIALSALESRALTAMQNDFLAALRDIAESRGRVVGRVSTVIRNGEIVALQVDPTA